MFGVKEKPKLRLMAKRSSCTGGKTNAACVSARSGAIDDSASTPRRNSPKRPPSTAPVRTNTAHMPSPRPEENFTRSPPKKHRLPPRCKTARLSKRRLDDCFSFFRVRRNKSCSTNVFFSKRNAQKNLPRRGGEKCLGNADKMKSPRFVQMRCIYIGQRQPIMRRASRLHSWDVFAYEPLPNRLRPSDLALGRLSKETNRRRSGATSRICRRREDNADA